MSRASHAFPFLTLPDEAVSFSGWEFGFAGHPLSQLEGVFEGWDYAADIHARSKIEVDFSQAVAALGLRPGDARLSAVCIVSTGPGTIPMTRVERVVHDLSSGSNAAQFDLNLPGVMLSGRVTFNVSVLLAGSPARPGVLSPTFPGSRLWGCSDEVILEGGGSARFPIEIADFKEQPEYRNVPWVLHWSPDTIYADFAGAVRLYVNGDRKDLVERLSEGDPLTLQSILGDVMAQLVGGFLEDETLWEDVDDFEGGTVGRQILNWMDVAFPGESIPTIRKLRSEYPGRFSAQLLAAADPGGAE